MKLGRNLARTFLDYYKLNGVISSKPSSSLVPKPGRYSAKESSKEGVNSESFEPHARVDERYVFLPLCEKCALPPNSFIWMLNLNLLSLIFMYQDNIDSIKAKLIPTMALFLFLPHLKIDLVW